MNLCRRLWLVLSIMMLPVALSNSFAAEADDWTIDSRSLPAPAAASDILRTSIANTPAPNVGARSQHPQTVAAWEALIAGADAAQTIPLENLEQMFGVSIEQDEIAGVNVYHVTPNEISPEHSNHLFLYLHGGAYVVGGGDASVMEAARIASAAGIRALSIDYRMPPAHPFPAAVDDSIAVYKEVLKTHEAGALAIGGTSAGSGLAFAAVHQMKSLDLPVPGAIYGGTPWADLTKTGDTLFTHEGIDRVIVSYDGLLAGAAALYADGHDMKDPLISPLYGDFDGFPPTFLISGTRDMLLSDTVRSHRKLRAAGVIADLHVYEGLSHAGYMFDFSSPESQDMYSELSRFLKTHLK
ncbi:MAG: alpha/beta hydrolase fold domain-containing protein [Proteobacteria bacterium]|nr:alpha/beta hydrolase fold domain-containing protein [Pseudomonadota bacterium]